MDPLSITVSALTLLGAGGKATKAVGNLVESLKNVDSRLTGLDKELCDLRGYLQATENALNACKQFDLSLVDNGLWQQSEIALSNCQTILNELIHLLDKIKNVSWPRNMGWKLRVIIDMKIHEEKLVGFHDKFHQSNSALQTMLHIIVVSISLRQNTSQNQILSELHGLKASIEKTWSASSKPIRAHSRDRKGKLSKSTHHVTHNLRHLAAAAENFYANASSTASTIRIDDDDSNFRSPLGSHESHIDYLPRPHYELMGEFLDNLTSKSAADSEMIHHHPIIDGTRQAIALAATNADTLSTSSLEEDREEDILSEALQHLDGDDHLELVFLAGLRELVVTTIKTGDYEKAIELIKHVISSEPGPKDGERSYRELYDLLILCYFCQGRWQLADPLVKLLLDINATNLTIEEELLIYNFSHALALGYLREFSFDQAMECCRQALLGKRRLCKTRGLDWAEYHETLALFATINEVAGDCVRAEIFRRPLPQAFVYDHPENELVFIQSHKDIVSAVLGSHDVQLVPHNDGITCHRSPSLATARESALHMTLSQRARDELDTSKEIFVVPPKSPTEVRFYEADDELSPDISSSNHSPPSPMRQQLTRIFRPKHLGRRMDGDRGDTGSVSPPGTNPSPKASTFRRFFNNAPILKVRRPKNLQTTEIRDISQENYMIESTGNLLVELEDNSPLAKLSDSATLSINPILLRSYQVYRPTPESPKEPTSSGPGEKLSSIRRTVYPSQEDDRHGLTQPTNHMPVSLQRPLLPFLPDSLEYITSQLTQAFASLSKNDDLQSLEEQERVLSELFPDFKALSKDKAMVSDTRVVIFSLRKRIAERQRAQEDSGYQSAASSDSGSASTNNNESQFHQNTNHYSVQKQKRPSIGIPKKRIRPPLILNTRISSSSPASEGRLMSRYSFLSANMEEACFSVKKTEPVTEIDTGQGCVDKEKIEEVKRPDDVSSTSREPSKRCLTGENPGVIDPASGNYWNGTHWLFVASDLK